MRRGLVFAILAIFLLSFGVACGESENENSGVNSVAGDGDGGDDEGDGDGEGGEGGDDEGNYDDLSDTEIMQQVVADAFCEAAWRCYDQHPFAAQLAVLAGRYGSEAECKANLHDLFGLDDSIEEAVASGRLIVDRSKADACRNDYREMLCTGSMDANAPASCLELLDGQVPEGEPCLDEIECEGALRCKGSEDPEICYGTCGTYESSGNDCGGENCSESEFCKWEWDSENSESIQSCATRYEEDEECEGSWQCAEGLICSAIEGVCVSFQVAEEGEECRRGEIYCEPGTRCDLGEVVLESPGVDGICAPLGDEGDQCLSDDDCVIGLHCLEDGEGFLGTCGVIVPLEDGEECSRDAECISEYCGYDPEDSTSYCFSFEELICELPE